MKITGLLIHFIIACTCYTDEITPYKFTDSLPCYDIPASSRFIAKSIETVDVIYYFSRPKLETYPIAILCGGSLREESIQSIIHVHRYFLKEFLDLSVGVITIEQHGVDGNLINVKDFMEHYTRSNRLKDHQVVIESLKRNPPSGWNGKFLFLGISEGGPLVTSLTTEYTDNTIATMNWSGAKDFSWREELWVFLQKLFTNNPTPEGCFDSQDYYHAFMDLIMLQPTSSCNFLGMTYKYHADAMLYPSVDYAKIQTPFLVVVGTEDTIIESCDAFVEKARKSGANVTYLRVEGMDHYIRLRPDIIDQSFEWLKLQLGK